MGKGSGVQQKERRKKLAKAWCVYREKGLNDVCLDRAERFVFDDDEDLLLFFQVDEVTKPGFFGKSVRKELAEFKPNVVHIHLYTADHFCNLVLVPYQSIDSEKQPPPHRSVGIQRSRGYSSALCMNGFEGGG